MRKEGKGGEGGTKGEKCPELLCELCRYTHTHYTIETHKPTHACTHTLTALAQLTTTSLLPHTTAHYVRMYINYTHIHMHIRTYVHWTATPTSRGTDHTHPRGFDHTHLCLAASLSIVRTTMRHFLALIRVSCLRASCTSCSTCFH